MVLPFGVMVATPPLNTQADPGKRVVMNVVHHAAEGVSVVVADGIGLGSAGVAKLSACGSCTRALLSTVAAPVSVKAVTLTPLVQLPTPLRGDDSDPCTSTWPWM